jgi:hypothetical protein
VELKQELRCHAFSIHHQAIQMHQIGRLFRALQQLRDATRQMLIASMGRGPERMTLMVM